MLWKTKVKYQRVIIKGQTYLAAISKTNWLAVCVLLPRELETKRHLPTWRAIKHIMIDMDLFSVVGPSILACIYQIDISDVCKDAETKRS